MKSKISEMAAPEPRAEMNEVSEPESERFRRVWAETGADYAFRILEFLKGRRSNEVSLAEALMTQTYRRSTSVEKNALRFVAAQVEEPKFREEEESRRLRERDAWLLSYVDGKAMGHADWVAEIQRIPMAIQRSQEYDAGMFSKTWKSPSLFSWIFGQAA